jgi:hypothetical protein
VHAADVKSVFRAYSIDVAAREKDDLREEPIVVRLRKVSYSGYRSQLSEELTVLPRPEAPVTMACNTMTSSKDLDVVYRVAAATSFCSAPLFNTNVTLF